MARETWDSKVEFILSTLGYSVGLGNVWRFPYVCYANGGGAFLIPYFVMLAVGVIPAIILEASLGQFTSLGCISCWTVSPLFKGLGLAMALVSVYASMYYPIIIAYTIRYMVASFNNPLPWVSCNNTWNTPNCFERSSFSDGAIKDSNLTSVENISMVTTTTGDIGLLNVTLTDLLNNETFVNATQSPLKRVRASEEYWMHGILGITEGLHDIGHLNWQMLLCFILAWAIVYLCLMKGIKSSGKAVYFTATFPYFVLFILLIRGVTLPGSADGIALYMRPKWEVLKKSKVWKSAANQVFYSYGAGWGGILTLASYNKFKNNCYRDAFMVCICCAMSSIFAGFVIFPVIGFMAWDSQLPVEKVIAGGPGLAFVAYPEALSRLALPQLWSFLFFIMLLTVGLDTEFIMLETFITGVVDTVDSRFPGVRRHKSLFVLGNCLILMVIGLPLTFEGGIYVMTLLDWYSAGFSPMLISFMEVLVISYVYGAKRFMRDIRSMIGYTPLSYWSYCWMFTTPIIIIFIIVFSFVDYTAAGMGDYTFPPWAEAIGWTLTMTSVVTVIIYAIVYLCLADGSLIERLRTSMTPSANWGPALNSNRIVAGYPKLPGQDEVDEDIHDKTCYDGKQSSYIPLATKDEDERKEKPVPV